MRLAAAQSERKPDHGPRRAFTLVELVIVACIVAILAGVTIPRMANTLARQRAVAAANRIVSDLRLAQTQARLTSAAKIVEFDIDASCYRLVGVASPDRPSQPYVVYLNREPYHVIVDRVDLDGDTALTFNGFGMPSAGGSIVILGGGHKLTINVDLNTGKATVTDADGAPVTVSG